MTLGLYSINIITPGFTGEGRADDFNDTLKEKPVEM